MSLFVTYSYNYAYHVSRTEENKLSRNNMLIPSLKKFLIQTNYSVFFSYTLTSELKKQQQITKSIFHYHQSLLLHSEKSPDNMENKQ